MTTYRTVTIAGAAGKLGPTLVKAIAAAGFESVAKVLKVDFDSAESLMCALAKQDVLVSNLPTRANEKLLIDAAIAAGVKRFLPSEFGSNVYGNSRTAAIPVFKNGKGAIERYLELKGETISWTIVVNGPFLEWGFEVGYVVNLKGTTKLFDGGNTRFSTTKYSDIAKAVVGVLRHPTETKNRAVYIQSTCITQNQILQIAKQIRPEVVLHTQNVSIEQVEKHALAEFGKKGISGPVMKDLILVTIFGPDFGGNWEDETDNDLLDVQELSQHELVGIVAKYL